LSKTDFLELREVVKSRSSGYCEKCGKPLGESWALHHRKLRSRGGEDSLTNFVALHHECHNLGNGSVHSNPKLAEQLGLMVPSWQDPKDAPLTLPSGDIVLLNDDGSYRYLERKENGW